MRISQIFLDRTRFRDKAIFALYAFLATLLFQVAVIGELIPSFTTFTFSFLLFVQFYVAAFLQIPIKNHALRIAILVGIFLFNYLLFRELAHALLSLSVRAKSFFEVTLAVVFCLTLVGRNIRIYISLIQNLERLNALRTQNQLFGKKEYVELNFGNEGKLKVHPNEIVYIRTKSAGDHTKIFGLKMRKEPSGQKKLVEYDTTAYRNFNEIFQLLAAYPQLKRISQSTVVNMLYPHEEKEGTLIVESRRFAIHNKYKSEKPV